MSQNGRNIVICCDGTANEPKARGATNVFELVGLLRGNQKQLVYYDPGLGTESAPGAQTKVAKMTTKLLGLAFGYGLSKNIADAYTYLMNHYEIGDRIYLFGFSRGAYTVRALAGMLQDVGLLEKGSDNLLHYAIRKYTQQGRRKWADIGAFKSALCRPIQKSSPRFAVPIHFLGVWDTVKSVGLFRTSIQLPFTRKLPNVNTARHAVAFDEKRSKYRPNLWTASGGLDGDVRTVWFAGVHADVGGGYPATERGLADITLEWMLDSATLHGLLIDRDRFETARQKRIDDLKKHHDSITSDSPGAIQSQYERVHNPLLPYWWIAGWWRRRLPQRAWIHKSIVDAITFNEPEQRRWPFTMFGQSPLNILHKIGDKDVYLEGGVLLLLHQEAVLIQHLRPGELTYLESNGLSDEADLVLRDLRLAGLKLWQEKLSQCFASGTINASVNAQQKAQQLLQDGIDAVQNSRIKGDNGAFAHLESFRRMTSLKNTPQNRQARQEIVDSAPYLAESLAEQLFTGNNGVEE